jgi:hypothetical protein
MTTTIDKRELRASEFRALAQSAAALAEASPPGHIRDKHAAAAATWAKLAEGEESRAASARMFEARAQARKQPA